MNEPQETGTLATCAISTLALVRDWERQFDGVIANRLNIDNPKLNDFRVSLIQEELNELKEALAQGNATKALDALTDIQWVLDGTYLALGLAPLKGAAFKEVFRSNMTKLGPDGKPMKREPDGKILKGPAYQPPQLATLLSLYVNLELV